MPEVVVKNKAIIRRATGHQEVLQIIYQVCVSRDRVVLQRGLKSYLQEFADARVQACRGHVEV